MNRMHPEDLKQLLAAMLAPMVTSQPETDLANGLEWADMLMGMAKTAKPEAEPDAMTFQLERDMLAWRQKAWANATRAEAAEARVKELETEVQRQKQCRERSIRLMGAKINRQRTQLNYFHAAGVDLLQVRAEKAEAALQTARADAAREERERLEPWIRHSRQCDMIQRVESYDCTCGLHESLEVKP